MTHRVQRVKELIRRELATILERNFTFGGCLVTIQDLTLPADLRQCFVYVSILGNSQPHEQIIKKLNDSHGQIQKDLFKRVILRNSPTLYFRATDVVERGVRVLNLIESLPIIPDEEPPLESPDGETQSTKGE